MFSRWSWQRSMLMVMLLVGGGLGGCATVPAGGDEAQNDPLEPINRQVLSLNRTLDRSLIKPIAETYRSALPESVRDRIRAFIDNLHEPLIFANDVLQGRGESAGITGRRFFINSTVGFLGFFDRADEWGMKRQSGDFGQTLYAWGVNDGPYLVLPFFGPTNIRDAVGLGVDAYASPTGHIGSEHTARKINYSMGITDGVDLRARNIETLESIEASSLDFYAYLRSVSRQHRQATLREARDDGTTPADDLSDPGAGSPAAPPAVTPPR